MPGKSHLNAMVTLSAKREWKAITLNIKLEVLRRFEEVEKLPNRKGLRPRCLHSGDDPR